MGSKTTSQVTNTPNPTASAAYNNVINQAQSVASTPYTPYTGELTAGLNGGQQRAIGQLEGAYGTARPFFDGGTQQLANASGGLGNVSNYLQAGSESTAGVQPYQAAASNQYGQANNLIGNAITGLGGVSAYQNAAADSYGAIGGMISSADTAYGQAGQSYGQASAGLGQVGQYLNNANGYFGQAASLATPQDFNGADGVSKYENPYTQDVINTTMATARQNDAAQTASVVGNAIGSGAYGGDRNGIAVAALSGQQDMANNSTIAGLNQANYSQATAQFNATQAQRQAGAGIYTNLGQGELQAGNTQLNDALGYAQVGAGQNANAAGYAGLGSLYATQGQGYAGLGQLQGQTAQEYGSLAGTSTGIGAGYNSTGQLGLGTAAEYGTLGQLQGTTGQAYGTLGGLYGNLGTQAQSAATSGASAGLQGATLQQQTQQAQDTANYGQFQNQIQYPFNETGFLSNIVQGIGSASGGTSTTQGSGLSQIAGAATSGLGVLGVTGAFGANGYLTGAGGLLSSVSDERAKDDKQPIGKTFDGQTIYSFRYKGDPKTNIGLMAQEVEGRTPDAVSHPVGLGGLKAVDYGKATQGAAERGHFARGGGLGNVARMMNAPDQIRVGGLGPEMASAGVPAGLGGIRQQRSTGGGLGNVRHHFDDGGTIGMSDGSLQSNAFAQDLAHNPLSQTRVSGGSGSTLPGGNLSRMPTASAAAPSSDGGGLGALTAAPSSGGGLSNLSGSGGGQGSGSSSSDTFGAGNQNLWMSLIRGGAGAMAGGSMSAGQNIGKGISDGLDTYVGLRQQDITNARAALELARQQQQLRIDQQRADQSGQQVQNEAAFQKGSLANLTAEAGVRQSTAASENAARDQQTQIGRYSTTFVPGVGYVTRDLTNPTAPPRVSPVNPTAGAASAAASAASGPVSNDPSTAGGAAPSTAATLPAAPFTPSASNPQPATASAVPPASAQPLAASPAVTRAGWTPTTAVPSNFVPPNQMAIYQNPGVLKGEQENAAKAMGEARDQAGAGQQLQMRLDEMDRQFAQLPSNGMLAPGMAATARADLAKSVNTFATTLGAQPPYDPNALAANENLLKDRFRLGADLAKQMGGREPGYIVEQAVKANPGADNTPLAYQRITAGLRQAAQYQQDRTSFFDDYNAKFGHLNGAQQAFDQLNPPQKYANRAVVSTVDPRDVNALRQNASNPAAASAIDRKYGVGTASTIMGQ